MARQRLLHDDQLKRVLVIATEASLLPQFVASYQRLGVLAPLHPQKYRPLPLDDSRCGFVLSEMGVAVVLEKVCDSEKTTTKSHSSTSSIISGGNHQSSINLLETAIAAETFDLIRSDPAMPALQHIAEKLFASVTASGKSIDVLHPHATGTPDHDPAELATYLRALNSASSSKNLPQLYASKGAFGHSLGAAGLASFVMACLSAQSHRLPPMPWLKNPVREVGAFSSEKNDCKTHAIFAAGFGGHTAGAVIG